MSENQYHKAAYLCSAHQIAQLPADTGREVIFAGRSNAGKSSVINVLTHRKDLARASKQPGRTRQLNFFSAGENTRLVDLPGYGYARVPGSLKRHWGRLIDDYLRRRRCLVGLILIVDIRRGLSGDDNQLLSWCEARPLPAHILLNKSDKLSRSAARQALLRAGEDVVRGGSLQLFSAAKKHGLDELTRVLDTWLEQVEGRGKGES